MFVYTVRKFNLFIITLLILTMVGYSLARFDPHSPWTLIGFWQGWSSYLVQLMEFNFGLNKNGVPIIHELLVVFPATIELCTIAFILSLLVGIPIGTLAGMRQGKWLIYHYLVHFDVGIFCPYFLAGADDDHGVFTAFPGISCGGTL